MIIGELFSISNLLIFIYASKINYIYISLSGCPLVQSFFYDVQSGHILFILSVLLIVCALKLGTYYPCPRAVNTARGHG